MPSSVLCPARRELQKHYLSSGLTAVIKIIFLPVEVINERSTSLSPYIFTRGIKNRWVGTSLIINIVLMKSVRQNSGMISDVL